MSKQNNTIEIDIENNSSPNTTNSNVLPDTTECNEKNQTNTIISDNNNDKQHLLHTLGVTIPSAKLLENFEKKYHEVDDKDSLNDVLTPTIKVN